MEYYYCVLGIAVITLTHPPRRYQTWTFWAANGERMPAERQAILLEVNVRDEIEN